MKKMVEISEETTIRHKALIFNAVQVVIMASVFIYSVFPSDTELHFHYTEILFMSRELKVGIEYFLIRWFYALCHSSLSGLIIYAGYVYKKFYRIVFLVIIPVITLITDIQIFHDRDILRAVLFFVVIILPQIYYYVKMIFTIINKSKRADVQDEAG